MTKRRKTRKEVRVRIPADIYSALQVALPFYEGKTTSGITRWSDKVRLVMQKCIMWESGNLMHRCRDTYVDRQLSGGLAMARTIFPL